MSLKATVMILSGPFGLDSMYLETISVCDSLVNDIPPPSASSWKDTKAVLRKRSPPCGSPWFSSVAQLWPTLWPHGLQHARPLSITNSRSLLKLISIDSVMPSNHPILCCPLFLSPSTFASIRVFCNESVLCIRWPKYWSFKLSISASSKYLGLISFQID